MLSNEYIAGLFDGEGCVHIARTKRGYGIYYYIHVSIANSDKNVLELVQQQFGGRISANIAQTNWPVWKWEAQVDQALPFLQTITPLTIIKRDQMELALEFAVQCHDNKYHWPINPMPEVVRISREQSYIQLKQLKRKYSGEYVQNNIGRSKIL